MACIARFTLAEPAAPEILFTADNEGHVEACASCPQVKGHGGLDRRATALSSLRGPEHPCLLIDGGNSFFGGDSAATRGQITVAAFNALHYDAMNLSWRDFHSGKQRTLELIKDAQFDVISANIVDEATGQLLAKPFVIKTVAGKKIAVIGLTQRPAAIDVLP
ncbi:MAG: UDP-sugar hydrolase, partial [Bryobacterales bacterium]|nr:UDP-sugar hydrolase [Bryobacterales bacterium]